MPLDYSHPRTIRFLKENYDRENEKRIAWFVKNKENIVKATTFSEKHKGYCTEHIARAKIEPLMPVLSLLHDVTKINRRPKVPLDYPVPLIKSDVYHRKVSLDSDVDEIPTSIMKPVDPDISRILFDGELNEGRRKYLNVRQKETPDKRFYYCETTNNVYGWKIDDSENVYLPSEHKRYAYLMRDARNRVGPQPDPKHYNDVQNYSKCS